MNQVEDADRYAIYIQHPSGGNHTVSNGVASFPYTM